MRQQKDSKIFIESVAEVTDAVDWEGLNENLETLETEAAEL